MNTLLMGWITLASLASWAGDEGPRGVLEAESAVLAQAEEPAHEELSETGGSEPTEGVVAEVADAAELEVGAIVSGVQAYYDAIESFHADFEQVYENEAMGETLVRSGHVFFKKPGRMRWDYVTPEPQHLISNGRTLWVYEPEFQQVYQQDLSESELPSAVRFLMGEGNLSEDFEISAAECGERTGVHCLMLVPRVSQGQYRSLRFIVSAADYSVVETTIVDPVGNTNRFVFSHMSTTDELPDEGFEFTPTPDMRVLNP